MLLQDNGLIRNLHRQVKMDLHAYAPVPGNKKRIGWFILDWSYDERVIHAKSLASKPANLVRPTPARTTIAGWNG